MIRWRRLRSALRDWIVALGLRVSVWADASVVRVRSDAGQTVAEYALVLLVVAAIAVAFLLWARQSGKLDQFFDLIFEKLINSVDPDTTPAP